MLRLNKYLKFMVMMDSRSLEAYSLKSFIDISFCRVSRYGMVFELGSFADLAVSLLLNRLISVCNKRISESTRYEESQRTHLEAMCTQLGYTFSLPFYPHLLILF